MRYTTIVGDRIQANVELERERVSDNLIDIFEVDLALTCS
jgi:hypothetical protein